MATKLFAIHGQDGVGMREIALKADVALPSISYHFGSKDNLYREAASEAIRASVDCEKLFKQAEGIDYADKQQVADTLGSILKDMAISLSRKRSEPRVDLICQALFFPDSKLHRALLDVFLHFEEPFIAFMERAGIPEFRPVKSFWLIYIWSQMLFYSAGREFVKVDFEMKSIPKPFYENMGRQIAGVVCREFGLPTPRV